MYWLKRIIILITVCHFGSSGYSQDFVFVKYIESTEKKISKVLAFKKNSTELKEFQNKFGVQKIDAETQKVNEINLEASCSDLQKLGVFINLEKLKIDSYSSIFWNNEKKDLAGVVTGIKETDDILFINLTETLGELFPRQKEDTEAWFEGNKVIGLNSSRTCELAGFGDGIKVTIGGQIFNIREKRTNADFPNIEPRQYVTIYEKRNEVSTKAGSKNVSTAEPIWWLVKEKDQLKKDQYSATTNIRYQFYPRQLHTVISDESILEIRFDNEALAKNIDFHGSISVIAKSGEKKIEVAPYSVIGEQKKEFGVDAMPIKEIADYFLRLIIESSRLNYQFNEIDQGREKIRKSEPFETSKTVNPDQLQELRFTLARAISILKSSVPFDSIRLNLPIYGYPLDHPLVVALKNLSAFFPNDGDLLIILNQMILKDESVKQITNTSVPLLTYKNLMEYSKKIQTVDKNKELTKEVEGRAIIARGTTSLEFKKDWKISIKEAKNTSLLCIELLKRIDQSNDQTINAFLSFTTLTITDFNDMISQSAKLKPEMNVDVEISDNDDDDENKLLSKIRDCENIFRRFRGSSVLFNNLISNIGYDLIGNPKQEIERLLKSEESYNRIRDAFAIEAGREIFKTMVYATIDLSKANLVDGSQLDIAVVWFNSEGQHGVGKDGSPKTGTELWTASFIVKKVGWHFDFSESAVLIQRIGENRLRGGTAPNNYPLSPSNFKPTAGANMLWSFYNPHRTLLRKKTGRESGFLKVIHWLEPSFGLNVSYLDFRTDRDVEFGAGPIMGFFQNRIFFIPWGYNFSVDGESPTYLGIGFSFSNVFNKIQTNLGK